MPRDTSDTSHYNLETGARERRSRATRARITRTNSFAAMRLACTLLLHAAAAFVAPRPPRPPSNRTPRTARAATARMLAESPHTEQRIATINRYFGFRKRGAGQLQTSDPAFV